MQRSSEGYSSAPVRPDAGLRAGEDSALETLVACDSPHGRIEILRDPSTGATTYVQSGEYQSACDRDGISLTGYIHGLFSLLRQSKARSVLMIGCGGGTLATMLAREGCAVTIADIDPLSFALARAYFGLLPSVRCHAIDGHAYVAAGGDAFDAIVLDAYCGDRIPVHLLTADFFRAVRARLRADGVFLVNIYVRDASEGDTRRIARTLGDVWDEVRLLDRRGESNRNAIAVAGSVAGLGAPTLRMAPAQDAQRIAAELAAMRYQPLGL